MFLYNGQYNVTWLTTHRFGTTINIMCLASFVVFTRGRNVLSYPNAVFTLGRNMF